MQVSLTCCWFMMLIPPLLAYLLFNFDQSMYKHRNCRTWFRHKGEGKVGYLNGTEFDFCVISLTGLVYVEKMGYKFKHPKGYSPASRTSQWLTRFLRSAKCNQVLSVQLYALIQHFFVALQSILGAFRSCFWVIPSGFASTSSCCFCRAFWGQWSGLCACCVVVTAPGVKWFMAQQSIALWPHCGGGAQGTPDKYDRGGTP